MPLIPIGANRKCIRGTATITGTVHVGLGAVAGFNDGCHDERLEVSVTLYLPWGYAYQNCADTNFSARVQRFSANNTCIEGTRAVVNSSPPNEATISGQTWTFSSVPLGLPGGNLPCTPDTATVTVTV